MNYLNKNKTIVELCGGRYGENHSDRLFFPYEFIPDIIQETFCAVAFEVASAASLTNETFVDITLYFFIMCHRDIILSEDLPGLRYDLIAHEIVKDFSGDITLGAGRIMLAYNKPYMATDKVRGRVVALNLYDVSQETYNKHGIGFI